MLNLKFHMKLWKLINSPNDALKWHESGESILVDMKKLKEVIAVSQFSKSKNINTFIRQLNLYGFKTVITVDETRSFKEYINPYFKRGCPDLLEMIERNTSIQKKVYQRKHRKASNLGQSKESKNLTAVFDPEAVKVKKEKIDEGYEKYDQIPSSSNRNADVFDPEALKVKKEKIDEEYEKYNHIPSSSKGNTDVFDPEALKVEKEKIDEQYEKYNQIPSSSKGNRDVFDSKALKVKKEKIDEQYEKCNQIPSSSKGNRDVFDPEALKVKKEKIDKEYEKYNQIPSSSKGNTDVFDPKALKVKKEKNDKQYEKYNQIPSKENRDAFDPKALKVKKDKIDEQYEKKNQIPSSPEGYVCVFDPVDVKVKPEKKDEGYEKYNLNPASTEGNADEFDPGVLKVKRVLIDEENEKRGHIPSTAKGKLGVSDPGAVKVKKEKKDVGYEKHNQIPGNTKENVINNSGPSTPEISANNEPLLETEYTQVLDELPLVFRTRSQSNRLADILTPADGVKRKSVKRAASGATSLWDGTPKRRKVNNLEEDVIIPKDVLDLEAVRVKRDLIEEEYEKCKQIPSGARGNSIIEDSSVQENSFFHLKEGTDNFPKIKRYREPKDKALGSKPVQIIEDSSVQENSLLHLKEGTDNFPKIKQYPEPKDKDFSSKPVQSLENASKEKLWFQLDDYRSGYAYQPEEHAGPSGSGADERDPAIQPDLESDVPPGIEVGGSLSPVETYPWHVPVKPDKIFTEHKLIERFPRLLYYGIQEHRKSLTLIVDYDNTP